VDEQFGSHLPIVWKGYEDPTCELLLSKTLGYRERFHHNILGSIEVELENEVPSTIVCYLSVDEKVMSVEKLFIEVTFL